MQYVSLGSDSEVAVGSAGTLTAGPFTLPAGAMLVVLVTFNISGDTAPAVAFDGGALTEFEIVESAGNPICNPGAQSVYAYKFRAPSLIAAGTVTATYSDGEGVRLLEVGKVEGADEDAGTGAVFSGGVGLSESFGPTTPSGNPVGIALAVHAAEVAPSVAAGSWSDSFVQAQRVGVDGGGLSNAITLEIAAKEYSALAPMSTTVTAGTSVERDGAFLFIAAQSSTAPVPVRRTVWSGGKVSAARFLGKMSRVALGGTVRRIIYQTIGVQPMFVNAADYSDIQDAVDAAEPVGASVFIPRGTYNASSTPAYTGLVIPAGVTVFGEGKFSTTLSLSGGSTSTHAVQLGGSFSGLADLSIIGAGSAGTGCGVLINPSEINPCYYPRLERVQIQGAASWGVRVKGVTVLPVFNDLLVWNSYSGGSFYGERHATNGGSTTFRFNDCLFAGPSFGTYGTGGMDRGLVHLDGIAGVSFHGCTFEAPSDSTYLSFDTSTAGGVCHNVGLRDCYMESGVASRSKPFITMSGGLSHLILDNLYVRSLATNEVLMFESDAVADVLRGLSLRNVSIYTNAATPSVSDFVFGAGMTVARSEDAPCYAVNANTGVARSLTYTGP